MNKTDKINESRRALSRLLTIGAPIVIMTISGRSALAATNQCTISGQLSGNMSPASGNNDVCATTIYYGRTPGHWGQRLSAWSGLSRFGVPIKPGTCTLATGTNAGMVGDHCKDNLYNDDGTKFHSIFSGRMYGDATLMQVIRKCGTDDRYQLGAHSTAAFLNATSFGKYGYGYSVDEVLGLWQEYAYGPNAVTLKQAFEYLNSKGG